MKKIIKKFVLLSTLLIATTAAMADATSDNQQTNTTIMLKKETTYFFAGVGTAKSDDFPEDSWNDFDYYYEDPASSNNPMFRIGFGYEKLISDKVGLAGELAYNNYGNDESSSYNGAYTYDYSAIDLLARLNYYFTPAFRGYIKAGVADERVDVSGFTNGNGPDDSSEVSPEFGIGASYFVSSSFAADLGYYVITGKDSDSDNTVNAPKISGVTLAINYYF